jgi:hypothetical protein
MKQFIRLAPTVVALFALLSWAASTYSEQSARKFATSLADAKRDASALQSTLLLHRRLTDLRLLLASTHNSDCASALKPVPVADERTTGTLLLEQDRQCAAQLEMFKSACGSEVRDLLNRVDSFQYFASALAQYEAKVQRSSTSPTPEAAFVTGARETLQKAFDEHIAPIGAISVQEVSSARRNCNDLNPLMRRQRLFRQSWDPLAQRFEIEQREVPIRYEKVVQTLTERQAAADETATWWGRAALALAGVSGLLLLLQKWAELRSPAAKS